VNPGIKRKKREAKPLLLSVIVSDLWYWTPSNPVARIVPIANNASTGRTSVLTSKLECA
jgi:hypothetical protein